MSTIPSAPRKTPCPACGQELDAERVGWECECGVKVCPDPACFDEYFKQVADGEATRCLSCGVVT
ncbi:MAG TPA: hypothetical protein VN083_00500 [Vicinamibacteria bacterium]|jgi:hypothetical protein|nr:hypothetical protein [Vicinamibacteria bacterium]